MTFPFLSCAKSISSNIQTSDRIGGVPARDFPKCFRGGCWVWLGLWIKSFILAGAVADWVRVWKWCNIFHPKIYIRSFTGASAPATDSCSLWILIQAYYIYPQSTQIFELFQYRSGGEATSMACIEFAFYSLHLIGPHIRPFIVLFQLSSHRNWHYASPTWWHENYVGQCAADRNVDGFKEWVGEEMLSKRLPKTQAPTHSALALLFLKDNN